MICQSQALFPLSLRWIRPLSISDYINSKAAPQHDGGGIDKVERLYFGGDSTNQGGT
jgi:hypothetical protein